MLSNVSSILFTKSTKITVCWSEHFSELLNPDSVVSETVVVTVQKRPIFDSLNSTPSIGEVMTARSKLNLGWVHGRDGICFEVFRFGGNYIIQSIHELVSVVWVDGAMPRYRKCAIILPLYKRKEARTMCGNYRGFNPLSAAG